MIMKLCACCLLAVCLCTCDRLHKTEEQETNLPSRQLHLVRGKRNLSKVNSEWFGIVNMALKGVRNAESKNVGISRKRRCSLNLCCPLTMYCCSSLSCCKGSKRTPQKPCFNNKH